MASIVVEDVTVNFPIYGANSNSFRHALLSRTGGLIRREARRSGQRVIVQALEDVSFELRDGDRLGLIGHNGAGKTTLLRVLAGIYEPDKGRVRTEGKLSLLLNSAPELDPEDTGIENIWTCGLYLGLTKQEIERKLPEIAEFSELGGYLNLPVRTYSAGMLTRLSFSIVTAITPYILLLDEGIAAGDARFASRAGGRMNTLFESARILVLASHAETLLKSFCNLGLVLENGRIIFFGPIDDALLTYQRTRRETTP